MYSGKAVYWEGKNKLKEGEISISDLGEDQALIEVKYCGICGTDLAIYKGIHPRVKMHLIMGHEFSGVIKYIKGSSLREGDKVVANPLISCGNCNPCKSGYSYICQNLKLIGIDRNGAFSKYVVVDKDKLYKIPDGLNLKTASLIEPFAVGAHAERVACPKKRDIVVILGGGPIGIAAGLFFKDSGVENIYFSEMSDYRLEVLKKFKFNVINPTKENLRDKIKKISGGKLADIVIEATGACGSVFTMVSLAKIRGLIILLGISHKHPVVDFMNVVFKELTIRGVRVYSDEDFSSAIDFVINNKEKLKDYISEIFKLDELKKALTYADDSTKSMKVVVEIT